MCFFFLRMLYGFRSVGRESLSNPQTQFAHFKYVNELIKLALSKHFHVWFMRYHFTQNFHSNMMSTTVRALKTAAMMNRYNIFDIALSLCCLKKKTKKKSESYDLHLLKIATKYMNMTNQHHVELLAWTERGSSCRTYWNRHCWLHKKQPKWKIHCFFSVKQTTRKTVTIYKNHKPNSNRFRAIFGSDTAESLWNRSNR